MDIERARVELEKDDVERPVPPALRPLFHQIAQAFANGDYGLRHHVIQGVDPVDPAVAAFIADYLPSYGDDLAPLDPQTWDRSIYLWMNGYWEVLVDLSTAGEKVSDLTLHAKLHEGPPLHLEIWSVHVP